MSQELGQEGIKISNVDQNEEPARLRCGSDKSENRGASHKPGPWDLSGLD